MRHLESRIDFPLLRMKMSLLGAVVIVAYFVLVRIAVAPAVIGTPLFLYEFLLLLLLFWGTQALVVVIVTVDGYCSNSLGVFDRFRFFFVLVLRNDHNVVVVGP